MKRALITGITGQDGSYLAELLLAKGYEVHGLVRRTSGDNLARIDHLVSDPAHRDRDLFLHHGDLADPGSLQRIVRDVQPDEVYNLAAQSHVAVSFEMPKYTADVVAMGTVHLLEAIADSGLPTRFYQASSSEMFGRAREFPQTEETPLNPRSPYAYAKAFAYWSTINYREAFGLHTSNGILYNHESPRRGETFVTRKITRAVARIVAGRQETVTLGNLEARRDWGYAPDYVDAMWKMLQQPQGGDYIIATGESHSVRDFCDLAFASVGLDWEKHVTTDPRHVRPTEVENLVGDAGKAREELDWRPTMPFEELVRMMVLEDLKREGLNPDDWIG